MLYSYSGRTGFIRDRQNRIFRSVCLKLNQQAFFSYLVTRFQNESSYKTFHMNLICIKMNFQAEHIFNMNGFERRCFDTEANSSYRSDQRFDMQFCFVLTLSFRLCAFLNKGIFDSRPNSNNSYCNSVYGLFSEQR